MGRRDRRPGLVRLGLAGGAVLGGGALLTLASFTDFASLNLGGGGGIGSSSKFDIALVHADGTVEQADTDEGVAWEIADAASFVPGRTLTTAIPVFNNSQTYAGELSLAIEATGDGSVGDSPNITRFMVFTAVDRESGEVLFGDPAEPARGVALSAAAAVVGDIAARGAAALADGDDYAPGAAGSERTVDLFMHYLDSPETAAYNGGQAAVSVRFDAQSK